jgi:hypothetical protein
VQQAYWTYIGIDRGERNPSWDNVVKLAPARGSKPSELTGK